MFINDNNHKTTIKNIVLSLLPLLSTGVLLFCMGALWFPINLFIIDHDGLNAVEFFSILLKSQDMIYPAVLLFHR